LVVISTELLGLSLFMFLSISLLFGNLVIKLNYFGCFFPVLLNKIDFDKSFDQSFFSFFLW